MRSNYKSDTIKVRSLLLLSCFLYSLPSPPCTHLSAPQRSTEQTHSPVKNATRSPATASGAQKLVYVRAAGKRHLGGCGWAEGALAAQVYLHASALDNKVHPDVRVL